MACDGNGYRGMTVRLPDFMGIGFQRCGTSWLDDQLRRHPSVWLPPIKELHYFDAHDPTRPIPSYRYRTHVRWRVRQYATAVKAGLQGRQARIPTTASDLLWDLRYFTGRADDRWYTSLFENAKARGSIVGEITPSYCMLSLGMIRRIYDLNPGLKLIFIMRDPIDRSWSQATKDLCRDKGAAVGQVAEETFIAFLRSDESRQRSDYPAALANWRSVFPSDQIRIVFFDDLVERPNDFLADILAFLGVPLTSQPAGRNMRQRINASTAEDVPARVAHELAGMYEPMLRELAAAFGAIPGRWHRRALDILACPS